MSPEQPGRLVGVVHKCREPECSMMSWWPNCSRSQWLLGPPRHHASRGSSGKKFAACRTRGMVPPSPRLHVANSPGTSWLALAEDQVFHCLARSRLSSDLKSCLGIMVHPSCLRASPARFKLRLLSKNSARWVRGWRAREVPRRACPPLPWLLVERAPTSTFTTGCKPCRSMLKGFL